MSSSPVSEKQGNPRSGRLATSISDENSESKVTAAKFAPRESRRDIKITKILLKKNDSGGVILAAVTLIHNLVALHFKYDQASRRFVEWAQNEIAVVPDFHKRILFSDEAHFWLNGYVNKQNCRIWSEANPQVYVETPLHPEKLTVWCALRAGGILLQKR
ncbi:hypothetical protein TNCV_4494281 [Trichonephila clavipes]|nr:hypothetical protein TNCV_4494281 [Trichonephila clavipes]